MSFLPSTSCNPKFFFKEHQLNLHNYWFNALAKKGIQLDVNMPARNSPFCTRDIEFTYYPGLICDVSDEVWEQNEPMLKEKINAIEPTEEGMKDFKDFMLNFMKSLPKDAVHPCERGPGSTPDMRMVAGNRI